MSILRELIINFVRVHLCKWMSYQPPSTHWSCKLFLRTRNEVRNIILRRETGPVMSFKTSIYILGNNSRINSVFWECISLDFLFHCYLMWIIVIRIGYCELFNFQYKLPVPVHTMPTRQSCKEKFYLVQRPDVRKIVGRSNQYLNK